MCLIELRIATGRDFNQICKDVDLLLKRVQLRPLARGIHHDRAILQLCYTSEVVESALNVLEEAALPGSLSLREGFHWLLWSVLACVKTAAQPPFL